MIHLWLPVTQGDMRVFHEGQWHRYDNWESLSKALQVYGLNKSPVCLYIPTVNVTQIRQPMTRQQLRQLGDTGVNYLLEDYVLGNVDDLYVRQVMVNDNTSNSEVLLTAISKHTVAQYKQSLSLVNLEISAILPDYLLLDAPKRAGDASVFADGITTLLRVDEHAGSASGYYAGSSAEEMVLMASKLPMVESYNVIGGASDEVAEVLEQTNALVNTNVGALTPVTLPERHALNLNPKVKRAGLPTYWKVVASVAALAIFTMLVYDGLRILQYKKLEKSYQAQVLKQYKQWFPNERPPADLKKALATKTSVNAEQGNALFSLMSSVSPLLKQSGLAANRVSFQNGEGASGILEISLSASNINDLQTLVNKMTAQGINAQLGNVTPVASDVEGIIKVMP